MIDGQDPDDVALDVDIVREGGFAAFIKVAWDQIVPDELIYEPHMDVIAVHYEAVYRNELKDLVLNVPPGTSKSTISSILFPVWCWIMDPKLKFMYTTYDQSLSHGFARQSMELIESDWFRARWPHVAIKNAARANVGDYYTTAGGRRVSTMMGGGATGKHCHILFVDDPHKPDDLQGDPDSVKKVLDEAWSRWIGTFSKRRAEPKRFRRVCIMQRLHEDDLAGRMLRDPNCVHVMLPMEFEAKRRCATRWGCDWRTEEGELLSVRFPIEVVEQDRLEMTEREFAAQHQQRPAPAEGNLFKLAWFANKWMVLPPSARFFISVDANLKDRKDSDFAVAQVWCVAGPMVYFVDEVRGQWAFSELVERIKLLRAKWPQVRNILIEDKANGTAVIDTLKRTIPGVIAIDPQGGKLSRADAVTWLVKAGNVIFPASTMADGLISEATAFPAGSYDDRVDAMTQFLNWISGELGWGRKFRQAMKNVRNGATFR
jgi:predicted phage terminase large subunit-like protein